MSKQSTRSKSKQGRANSRPSNGAAAKANGTSSAGSAVKTSSAAASTTTPSAKAVTTQPKASAPAVKAAAGGAPKQAQPESKSTGKSARGQRKQQRIQNRLAQQQQDARHKRNTIILVAAALVVVAGLLTFFFVRGQTSSTAQTVISPNYQPIDGIYCDANEQLAYHIHAHLTIYVDGQPVALPQSIGIAPGTTPACIYWLHTHATDGVIHIESPTQKLYTLQNFFDIWQSFASQQITYPTQLASAAGWTIYVNGKQVHGDFKSVSLNAHDAITIAYNSPNIKPDTNYNFSPGE